MSEQQLDGTGNDATSAFARNRSLLVGVAYRLLGTVSDAEDVVQEAWLRWARVDTDAVRDPTAFLVRTVSRLAIDRLRQVKARRESYVGPWLPEPLLTGPEPVADPAADVDRAESVSMAMLVVLETLSPLERTVFVLHEAFGYEYADIAEILDRTPPTVRQLAHRAREHVQARRPRYETDPAKRRAATERFLRASTGGNLNELLELLAPDATLWADGGGKTKAPRRPIHGRDKIARFFVGISGAGFPGTMQIIEVNGGPAAVLNTPAGPVAAAMVDLDPDTGLITVVRLFASPDKMSGLALGAGAITERNLYRGDPPH
jgi:RNA polymerase sigma factor (sigma-70 family)